jgi:hypothetical protein
MLHPSILDRLIIKLFVSLHNLVNCCLDLVNMVHSF